jgi:hypothetical protein
MVHLLQLGLFLPLFPFDIFVCSEIAFLFTSLEGFISQFFEQGFSYP